jgi:RHS repeat-associated protein
MTMTEANPVWLGITNVAVLPVDASHYVASIETGHAFVPKTPETFTYDADGNLLSDGRWTYTWDAENRLLRVQSRSDTPQASWRRVEWQYDALGRRIRQTTWSWLAQSNLWVVTEDLRMVSDPLLFGRHLLELNATNVLVRSYVWGLDLSGTEQGAGGVGGLLWVTLHTGSGPAAGTHFAAYDGNGNVVALSAASDGSATARYEYGPFGEPLRVTGPAAPLNPFRFSTKRTCNTSDLVLYEYRAYSPTLGRWASLDLIEGHGGADLYGFAYNSPLAYIDRHGLQLAALLPGPTPTVPSPCPPVPTPPTLPPPRPLPRPTPLPPSTPPTTPCRRPPAGGAAAACVAAAVIGWEIGRAIDEAQGGLISDYWGEQFVNCYQVLKDKCRRPCPPCKPYPEGTRAYRIDRVPPSSPHCPWPGDHLHWFRVNQDKVSCKCFWNKDKKAGPYDETEPIIPQGGTPTIPAGAIEVPPFPKLTP